MPNQDLTDDELAQRAKNGDNDAFKILYHRHYLLVYMVLKRSLNWPDGDELRALVDEAFTHAWKKLHKQNKNFPGWLCTLAKNLAIDKIRKEQTHRLHEQTIPNDLYAMLTDDPEEILIMQEYLQEIKEAFQKLSEVERMCLVLSIEGHSTSEIVEAVRTKLGITLQENSVRTYISTARCKLRNFMHLQTKRLQKKRPKNNRSPERGDK